MGLGDAELGALGRLADGTRRDVLGLARKAHDGSEQTDRARPTNALLLELLSAVRAATRPSSSASFHARAVLSVYCVTMRQTDPAFVRDLNDEKIEALIEMMYLRRPG